MFSRSFFCSQLLAIFLAFLLVISSNIANEQKLKFRSGTKAALSTSSSSTRGQNQQKSLSTTGAGNFFSFPFSRIDRDTIIVKNSRTPGKDNFTNKSNKKSLKKARYEAEKPKSNVIISSLDSAKRDFLLYKDNMVAAEDNYERIGVTVDALLRNRVALAITTIGIVGAVTKLLPPNPQK